MSSHNNPENSSAQQSEAQRKAQEAADKKAKELAQQSDVNPDNTDDGIWGMIMQFIQFLFGSFLGDDKAKDEAPHESTADDAPNKPEYSLQVSRQLLSSKALTKWRDYQQEHKGEKVAYTSPVKGDAQVTSGFGHREAPKAGASTEHKGIDIGARGSDRSPEIVAAADGMVLFAGRRSGYGNAVIIGHADGSITLYGHLSGAHMPAMGTAITQGTQIGEMGNSGNSTGPHLHFEVRKGDKAITPVIDGVAAVKGMRLNDDAYYASLMDRNNMPKLPVVDVDGHGHHNVTNAKPKSPNQVC